jgi:hypothetical protein
MRRFDYRKISSSQSLSGRLPNPAEGPNQVFDSNRLDDSISERSDQ